MRQLGITVLVALLWMSLPGEVFAQSRLTVSVVNHSANGATVVGDEVTVQFFKGREPTDSRQAKVGADGKAVFENVPTGQDMAAVVRARHQNMAFNGRPVSLSPTATEFSAGVSVFDVSTDTSKLSVGTHHIMVAVRSGALEFTEYLQLNNSSDRAVTGARKDDRDRPVVLEVKLPAGFQNLTSSSYFEEAALVVGKNGFYDTMAVPPGEQHVAFSYKLEIDRHETRIDKEITLPTAELTIFWEHGQGKLVGLGEPSDRMTNAEGVPIEYYRRDDLKPGDKITFQISGFNVKHSDSYTWLVLAAVFVAIVVVALLRLRPRPTHA